MRYNDRDFEQERQYEEWHRYGNDRGFFDRVRDEVKSWFGDEEAERRRRMDQSRRNESDDSNRFGRDEQTPEWQRRGYSGSSPRGSYVEPMGRYDQQNERSRNRGLVRKWNDQRRHEPRWGENRWQQQSNQDPRYQWGTDRGFTGMGQEEYGGHRFFDNDNDRLSGNSMDQGMYGSTRNQEHGLHRGRGPRNYNRADERIIDEIHYELTMHPDLDATDIDVLVESGIVTLRGAVDSRHAKRLAEDISEDTFGVKEVHNELRVNRGDFSGMPQANEQARRSAWTTNQ